MDLLTVVGLFRRRWIALVLAVLAGLAGAVVVSVRTPDTYQASSRLFVNLPVASGVQEALQGVQLSSQLLQSYAAIATSRTTAELISSDLGGRMTAGEVRGRVRAEVRPNTLLLDVIATHEQPAVAKELADTAAVAVTKVISDLESNKQNPVEARVIDKASLPSTPISPKPLENALTGLGIGLAVGIALALTLESLDRSPRPAPSEAAPPAADKVDEVLAAIRELQDRVAELKPPARAPRRTRAAGPPAG
ncbi:MAG: tyrosine-protein kinase [Actinomycetota bacterium]|jgi:capsular polysaccharide biosynthesis protein|nr:tyrosine-protein kinase [Actinomycetota bacterium]